MAILQVHILRGIASPIICEGGGIFIYSSFASLINFFWNCFSGLQTWIYTHGPLSPIIEFATSLHILLHWNGICNCLFDCKVWSYEIGALIHLCFICFILYLLPCALLCNEISLFFSFLLSSKRVSNSAEFCTWKFFTNATKNIVNMDKHWFYSIADE